MALEKYNECSINHQPSVAFEIEDRSEVESLSDGICRAEMCVSAEWTRSEIRIYT